MLHSRSHFLFGVVCLVPILSALACQRSEKTASPNPVSPTTSLSSNPPIPVPFNTTPPAKEDPEVAAYFREKGWDIGEYQHMTLPQMRSILSIENRNNVFEKIAISAEDWKMIERSKAVNALNLSKAKTDDEGLGAVARMTHLEAIGISGEDVTNVGIKALAKCKSLEVVLLINTKNVTDAGVKELAALPNLNILSLTMLHLDGSAFAAFAESKKLQIVILDDVDGFTDEGAKCLAKLPNLTGLMIRTSRSGKSSLTIAGIKAIVDSRIPPLFEFDKALIDDALFESLVAKGWLYGPSPPRWDDSAGLRYGRSFAKKPATPEEVTTIFLDESKVTDATLMNLSRFTELNNLYVGHTKVTGSGLERITGLPIKKLNMEGCGLSEIAFKAIAKMSSLEDLYLYRAKTKGEWLKHISTLPNLKKLNLTEADFDDGAAKYLTTMPELEELGLNYTALGNAGFLELVKMPTLRELYIQGTKVTKEVVEKAKKEHPNLQCHGP